MHKKQIIKYIKAQNMNTFTFKALYKPDKTTSHEQHLQKTNDENTHDNT